MENIKQYLPWIIGAIVIIYVLRKATTRTGFAPQTQLTQTPQPDIYAEARSKAFDTLASLGITQIESDTERARLNEASLLERARLASAFSLEQLRIGSQEKINLSAIDLQRSLGNLQYLQRNQDTQLQQSAIDRYYSSRNTQSIVGSVSQALSSIFGNRQGGNVFGTPKTFPTTFSFGGF